MQDKVVYSLIGIFLSFTWHSTLYADTEMLLHASTLTSKQGIHSDQSILSLSVQDQSGGDDDWLAYTEFYPNAKGYTGIFTFDLPASSDPSAITALSFTASYKGAERSEQRWQWQIRDFYRGEWVFLADNIGVPDWEWSLVNADVNGVPAHYVNSKNRLELRYLTLSGHDDSDLDYLALCVRF
ncbi:MAG: hypothetical protein P8179_15235 [Candidatus Thiodiazotropha sp.]|jgi:hypothetical protein